MSKKLSFGLISDFKDVADPGGDIVWKKHQFYYRM
jgi:hypothetical protein